MSETKRQVGRPPVNATPVTVRIPPDQLDALNAFAASEADMPTRPEAVRRILRDWLVGHGYLKGAANE